MWDGETLNIGFKESEVEMVWSCTECRDENSVLRRVIELEGKVQSTEGQ